MGSSLLTVKDLSVSFATAGSGNADEGHSRGRLCHTGVYAVRDVSFSIGSGEALGLVGESGSGKSVTSLAIMRLLAPQARASGEIWFQPKHDEVAGAERIGGNGPEVGPAAKQNQENLTGPEAGPATKQVPENLLELPDEKMRAIRGRQIAMIFQEPMSALNPVMRVGDQIAEAVLAHDSHPSHPLLRNRWGTRIREEAWRRAVDAMREVAIPEHERRARDYPHQLSGGMRQRVMIAMMLVNRPQLLIADEPTTALDVTIQAQILELLTELRRKFGLAMLFISHDLGVVSQVAERVAVMYAGRIVEMGGVKQVFANAMHPYTRGLMQAVPSLRTERGKPLYTIEGSVPNIASLPPGCSFAPRCGIRIPECEEAVPQLVEVEAGHWARCLKAVSCF